MDGHPGLAALGQRVAAPAQGRDGDDLAEQRTRRGGAERDDERRADQRQLLLQPPAAGGDLAAIGLVVDAPLAAPHELEMLDRVGDVGARARSTPASASARSKICPAGPTNGRPARSSWSPGCSPTNRIARIQRPFAEHGLGRAFVEVAAGAVHRLGADRLPGLQRIVASSRHDRSTRISDRSFQISDCIGSRGRALSSAATGASPCPARSNNGPCCRTIRRAR